MHYYGHGSWIALVIFGAVVLIRLLSSQRRRDDPQGQGPTTSSFTGSRPAPPSQSPSTPMPSSASASASGTGLAPGWFTDPTGRHGQRYWSGAEWTEHVVDDGVPGTDPPPQAPPGRTPY